MYKCKTKKIKLYVPVCAVSRGEIMLEAKDIKVLREIFRSTIM